LTGGLGAIELVVFSSRATISTTTRSEQCAPSRRPNLRAIWRCSTRCARRPSASCNPWRRATRAETIAATRAAGEALAALGVGAGVPIVTPAFARRGRDRRRPRRRRQTVGAGGGDVGIALFTNRDAAQAFMARAQHDDGSHGAGADADATSIQILDLTIDENGLHRRTAGNAKLEHHA